ncbi:hypothetical protein FD755_020074 [Muntiacus reevesi]|uniref:Proteasome assembly chaperone 2 n=1 Tax=Muntiacus reevesi TaxID=9886 RepID=A0A5N3X2E4_MUNRE|nr:hypothetical protein FD755_020074 [Muntiacus reevesi]
MLVSSQDQEHISLQLSELGMFLPSEDVSRGTEWHLLVPLSISSLSPPFLHIHAFFFFLPLLSLFLCFSYCQMCIPFILLKSSHSLRSNIAAAGSSYRRRNHVRPLRGLGPRPRGVHSPNVYALPSKKLVALQLRSIFIKYKSKSFCEKLLSWVKCSGCAKVVVLSSSHSYHRNDLQLRSTPFRYLLTPSMQKSVQNKIQSLNWEEMEKTPCIPEIDDSEFCVRVPGGGITKMLYDEGCSKEIPIAILLKFVSEGDNIPDALGLVEYLNEWLQIIKPHCEDPTASSLPWKMPSSWRLLFGSGLPPALF